MAARTLVFIGSYTRAQDPGIGIYELDRSTGVLTPVNASPPVRNPSYLAISRDGRFIYCVCEESEDAAGIAGSVTTPGIRFGAVAAFAFDAPRAALTRINIQPSHGAGPCHLSLDATGNTLLVANYGAGSVASYPIRADGSIGPAGAVIQHRGSSVDRSRQEGPHAHSIYADPSNRFALAVDLGLDQVVRYKLDAAAGVITPTDAPAAGAPGAVAGASAGITPGAGPRHMVFAPSGKHAYIINELNNSLSAYAYDASTGALTHLLTTGTLPPTWTTTNYPSHIGISPDGRFVYGSNRLHDSIAIFAVDQADGTLSAVGHEPTGGKWPRGFGISPRGDFLLAANERSHDVFVFRIDARTGLLKSTGHSIQMHAPACVHFVELDA